ncbi:hypothetical protein [Thermobifida cellulosilytica]|uniref:hypothetical protein n=1 Tax=Thermobifida cellulosilytica TaxID=144786 RepID=UPI0012EDE0CA|nr:hypothetical protein [Thermobifida cellulosilytica]
MRCTSASRWSGPQWSGSATSSGCCPRRAPWPLWPVPSPPTPTGGPLRCAAFPEPLPGSAGPEDLTGAQRASLRALVANDALWDGRVGSAALALRRAGLPGDRESCRRLAGL